MAEERIQKILARAGYGSRRSSEELIITGRVTVNGKRAELGAKADAAVDRIAVDGSVIASMPEMRYIAYNKPRFMLCDKTLKGDTRRTVFDAVPGGNDLAVVGRLDFESEGLILLTNDGDMVNKLTHPRYEHEKEYRVLLSSKPDAGQLETWKRGIVLEDGHRTAPVKVQVDSQAGKGTWLRVVMKEGRKRQIRETATLLGLYVVRILRTRIGSITLGTLKTGEYRELTKDEVSALKIKTGGIRPSKKPITKKSG
ncbi:MAG: pseudouridine synthase [Anaerolineaceae bacterium]|jgi:23S rRNA pseudouridine2605 synthase